MGFKCGLVGLPNVGKSTIFNKLTDLKTSAENFPFCTIKPNFGITLISDNRLNILSNIANSNCIIPTYIELVDIAGLVKGAHQGEGLGNNFLHHIKTTDLIVHVVRSFKNDNISHVYGRIDPIADIEIINLELILSDFDVCTNRIKKLKKNYTCNKTIIDQEIKILLYCLDVLEKNKFLKSSNLTSEEIKIISHLKFITLKPMMYVVNASPHYNDNVCVQELLNILKRDNSCVSLVNINDINDNCVHDDIDTSVQYETLNLNKLGLKSIAVYGYKLLKLKTFFTVGEKEVRAWTTISNIPIRESVRCIHTDFSIGFIRAQIISYSDFVKYNGQKNVKKHGKMRVEGKNYCIHDGDIVNVLYKK
ncbi:MAG: redox-regulated ATPase YchF [Buchnera aphidicola (Schlechtendalia peitan)]